MGDRPPQYSAPQGDAAPAPAALIKDLIPRSNKEYLNIEYWDKRFEVEESFEWCGDYAQFRHLLLTHIRPCDRVLILGNGTSDLPECLWRDGRRHITATDLSAPVVTRMALRSAANGSAAAHAWPSAAGSGSGAAGGAGSAAAADGGGAGVASCVRACGDACTHVPAHAPAAAAGTATCGESGGAPAAAGDDGVAATQALRHSPLLPAAPAAPAMGGRDGGAADASAERGSGDGGCNVRPAGDGSRGGEGARCSSGSSSGSVCECGRLAGITWAVADMMDLPFTDGEFDVVLEKGVLDVLLVDGESPWRVSRAIVQRVHSALSHAHRVLAPHGRMLCITFGQPHFRRPLYEAPHLTWTLQHTAFGDSFHYFLFHLVKGSRIPTATEGSDAASEGDLVITLPGSASSAFDLEHEFLDSDDFFSRCSIGLDA